jgi:DNA polymerase Ligase (LigD)
MPEKRFVIQKHTQEGQTHWDLMIEWPEKLKTWRLENPPEKLASEKTKATPIFDHNKKFLTYQGPVNNGIGNVEIVEEGICTIESTSENEIKINFDGRKLKNRFRFFQQENLWFFESTTTSTSNIR